VITSCESVGKQNEVIFPIITWFAWQFQAIAIAEGYSQ
jgi:hypothetical protein